MTSYKHCENDQALLEGVDRGRKALRADNSAREHFSSGERPFVNLIEGEVTTLFSPKEQANAPAAVR